MEEQINSPKSELWSLSVKDLFYKYVRFLPLFVLSVALSLLVAFIYLRYATMIYSASGTMLIKSQEQTGRTDKVEEILSGSNRNQSLENEVEVLKSKPLMARVVNRLNLQFSYTAKGNIKDYNVYTQGPFIAETKSLVNDAKPFTIMIKFVSNSQFRIDDSEKLYGFRDDISTPAGVITLNKKFEPKEGNEFGLSWQPTESAAGSIISNLSVQPKSPGTGILTITVESTNPQMAADIVNNLMVQYDSMTIEQNNYSTDQMVSFIDGRLDNLRREVDSVQTIFLAYQQKENIIDIDAQLNQQFTRLGETDVLINEQRSRLQLASVIEDYLRDSKNQFTRVMVPSSLGLEDLTLNELVNSYNRGQMERQSLLDAGIPSGNAAVKQAESLIEKQRQSLLENIGNIKSSLNGIIANLSRRNADAESGLRSLPYKIREYVEIQRQVNTKLALYNLLEGKREEAAISRAATISSSTIFDSAYPSTSPVKPSKSTVQIIAALIGLALPALFIFLKEILNDKITTRHDIERITNAPIMGEIGHSYSDNVLIVNRTSRSMVAEQFRIIRSNLQYVLHGNEKPVILVTSSFSGEGKSFISTNMAAVMALTSKRTVVLEFDIRKPKVLSGLNMGKHPGISNFLVGKADLANLVIPVPDTENLYVLPCGPIPPNPSELLLGANVTELFAWLKQNFDVIIIDTAPVGMVSDAMTLAAFADCTLYLVRQGHTYKKQVALIDELYREGKLPKVSIVINDVKVKAGYGYYGYGRYGYGYGYGQSGEGTYFEEEVKPKSFFDKFLSRFNTSKKSRKQRR